MNSEFVLGLIGSGCGWFALTRASFMRDGKFSAPQTGSEVLGTPENQLGRRLDCHLSERSG